MFQSYQQNSLETSSLLLREGNVEINEEPTFFSKVTKDVSKLISSVSFRIILLIGVMLMMYSTSGGMVVNKNTRKK
jgi:hypothetical protein